MIGYQVAGRLVLKDPTSCPHCFRTATGYASIVETFGLRSMDDGTIRVQSWCRQCRNESKEVSVQ